MSLIEKLGGYEAAKNKYSDRPHAFVWGDIGKALLSYRRQHNIFEVGDAIVRRWNNRVYWIITDIDNGSEFMISENKNAKFKDCKVCDMPCNFTHATDKEITKGYRDD